MHGSVGRDGNDGEHVVGQRFYKHPTTTVTPGVAATPLLASFPYGTRGKLLDQLRANEMDRSETNIYIQIRWRCTWEETTT